MEAGMQPDLAVRLRRIARGGIVPETGVTPAAGVANVPRYALKPQELRQLRPLRVKIDDMGMGVSESAIDGSSDLPEPDEDAIEERAALCADSVPPIYLDAWARLNHQKPDRILDGRWRQVLDDGGRFLDRWGSLAAQLDWTACALFDTPKTETPGGLLWRLDGGMVEAIGPVHARLSDGRIIARDTSSPITHRKEAKP
jgi:hypothetical protein